MNIVAHSFSSANIHFNTSEFAQLWLYLQFVWLPKPCLKLFTSVHRNTLTKSFVRDINSNSAGETEEHIERQEKVKIQQMRWEFCSFNRFNCCVNVVKSSFLFESVKFLIYYAMVSESIVSKFVNLSRNVALVRNSAELGRHSARRDPE